MNNPQKPNKNDKPGKPPKPYPEYPLYAHGNGQWAKRIRGKIHYFGPWADPQGAVDEFVRVRDALYAGRPRPIKGDVIELWYACNAFLTAKEKAVEAESIMADMIGEYTRTCNRICAAIGKDRDINTLGPAEFTKFRESLAEQLGPTTVKNELTRAKTFFNWLFEGGLLATPLAYRAALKPPSARVIRKQKIKAKKRTFTQPEIHSLINHAHDWKRPAIYLGINCGIGNTDLCEMEWEHVDLRGGWLDFPRPKTFVERRAKLWPETVAALRAWKKESPESLWVCCYPDGKQLGQGETRNNPIAHRFRDIMTAAQVDVDEDGQPVKNRQGRGFYALRHTFRTVADGCKDQVAIAYVMGHADHSIAGVYRESIDDDRLVAVAEWVRKWFRRRTS